MMQQDHEYTILHVQEEVTEKVPRSTDTKQVRQSCNMVWRQMFLFELTRFNNKELFVIQKKKHCTVSWYLVRGI